MPKNFGIGRTSVNVRACNSADHQLRLSQRRDLATRVRLPRTTRHTTAHRTIVQSCRYPLWAAEISASPYSVGGKDVTRDQQSNGAAPARQHDPGSGRLGQKSGTFPRRIGPRRRRSHRASRRCAIAFSSSPLHKLDPDAFGLPDGFHFGARLGLVHAKYVAAKAIEERRDPSVGDAVHVHRGIL
jgi:hypothetical protein